MSGEVFRRLVGWVARRPATVVGVVVVLAVAAAAFAALTLRPTAGADTLVGRSSDTYQATQRYHQRFGDDAVIVLVRGELTKLVLTADIQRVLGLEGCLSGNLPPKVKPRGGPNGPCAQLARTKPVQVVYGPGTFINESVRQISDEFQRQQKASADQAQRAREAAFKLARAKGRSRAEANKAADQAQQLVNAGFTRDVLRLALRYGLTDVPRLNDPQFVARLVFDASKKPGTPKARFAYLFPTSRSALVSVRLKPSLSEEEKEDAIAVVRRAVAMPDWRLAGGADYVVTGAPVVVSDLSGDISGSLLVLLVAALVLMAGALLLVFRARMRLLPLGVALLAAALTFGALALVGAPLTMATIGVLPVLIGLAVDYAIQIQSRVQEEGDDVERAAQLGVPTIATAGAATAAGFLVLALSPVPMVRDFGLLLVVGIVLALACALTAGIGVLVLARDRRRPAGPTAGERLAPALRGAEDLVLDNRVSRAVRRRLAAREAAAPEVDAERTNAVRLRALALLADAALIGAAAALAGPLGGPWPLVVAAVVAVADLVVAQGRTGRSAGKALVGLRVLPSGVGRAAARFAVLPVDLLVAGWSMARSEHRRRLGDRLAATVVVRDGPGLAERAAAGAMAAALGRPARVLGIAAAVAVTGWALDTQASVETDVQKLVPQDLQALRDLRALQESTGVGGEIDVVVRAEDLTDPAVLGWMGEYQQKLLKRYGYSAKRGCGKATLCPAFSLTDLLRTQGQTPTKEQLKALLDAVPPYFSQAVITGDRTTATLAFGIRLMPLDRQADVVETMRSELDSAPEGIRAELAGLPVLAADANAKVSSPWRRFATLLAGLAAVALVLLAAFRDRRRALLPLVPIALATGWSALVLFALRIDLNPMSVTLGALVIAISTEFSVLLSERYRQERAAGHREREALARTYRSTGAAVLASGATAIAGFAVLSVSDIRMLRDFGWVTVVDLTVSLLGVLVVLPAVLVLRRSDLTVPRLSRPRLRRRADATA